MKINIDRMDRLDRARGVIADVKHDDMSNGVKVRETVFASYCPINCFNCFNRVLQNRNYGYKEAKEKKQFDNHFPAMYSKEVEDYLIEGIKPDYIDGLTLLGGEPFLNTKMFVPLCKRVRAEFGDSKTIWSWTGFEWNELLKSTKLSFPISQQQKELLNLIDVLVDGRYVDSIRKLDLIRNKGKDIHFRGSSNQRIIDVKRSLKENKVVELTNVYNGEKIVNRNAVGFKSLTGKETPDELVSMGL